MNNLMVEESVLDLQRFTPDNDIEFCPSGYSGCPSGVSYVDTTNYNPL